MPGCTTNCIEKPIAKGFEELGRFIGRHPWWFLIIPFFISAGLTGGFYFFYDCELYGIEVQFTPWNGPAKDERKLVQTNFPLNDTDFSRLRLYTEGTFASLILTTTDNILTTLAFQDVFRIDEAVKNIQVANHSFMNLCAKKDGECVENSIFTIVGDAGDVENTFITYPFNGSIFTAVEIGGVTVNSSSERIESAHAIRLYYFLNDINMTANDLWLREFMDFTSHMDGGQVSVSYFTSLSRDEEFEKTSDSIIPLFAVTYALAISFSILSVMRLDCVRTKVWVASIGVLSAGLAVLSSFGLLLYCGMPFVVTVLSGPFLVLGIGLDDMFIMISCWQKTKVDNAVEDRMAETYKEAAVSITITTVTNVLSFYVGLLTPIQSVQSFSVYNGTALLFCYLLQITFFGAFLALNGQREKSNRHWFTCKTVPKPTSEKYNRCKIGGAYDKDTGAEELRPVNHFFKHYYGPFLTNKVTKVFVMLLYAGYLAISIYGCFLMEEGIDEKHLANDDSYVASYYDDERGNFLEYGAIVMLVVTDTEFKYWDKSTLTELDNCLDKFESLTIDDEPLVAKNMTISWLHEYLDYGAAFALNLTDRKVFIDNLPTFFSFSPATHDFRQDVNFSVRLESIYTSRIFVPTVNVTTTLNEKNMLIKFRDTAKECPGSLVVYHPSFIFFDQYLVIIPTTIQNIVVATVISLAISLLLIPNPVCSFWVTFAIGSIIVGVSGFMALWDVNLDPISMIILVICIGFSVDFSAHISYHFVSSKKTTVDERVIDAIFSLGYPIIQGATSTILGVVVLAAADCYIFRTFFKIMVLVIGFGALHGVVFLPVFLTLLKGPYSTKMRQSYSLKELV